MGGNLWNAGTSLTRLFFIFYEATQADLGGGGSWDLLKQSIVSYTTFTYDMWVTHYKSFPGNFLSGFNLGEAFTLQNGAMD